MSYRGKVLLKVGATLALLLALAYRMDLRRFAEVLTSADLGLVLLAIAVQLVATLLFVLRSRTILQNFDIFIETIPLAKITLIGYFFNLFLPTGIGGDFFRAYYLSRRKNRGMSITLTALLLERSSGLFGLVAIGTAFAAVGGIEFEGLPLVYVFLGVMAFYVLGNVVLFHSWIHERISHLLRRRNLEQMEARMELVYKGLNALRGNKRAIFLTVLFSLLIQFLAVVVAWISASALGADAPFMVFLTLIPLINLSIMVPLTINGMGLREALFFLVFPRFGVPAEVAVSSSVVWLCITILISLPGGLIYSLYKKDEQLEEILTEAGSS